MSTSKNSNGTTCMIRFILIVFILTQIDSFYTGTLAHRRGLRKYLNAASNLFDAKHSRATLLSLETIQEATANAENGVGAGGIIEVTWEISGVLMLPWRPKVKPWSGWTRYHLDEDGLVAFHEEGWDISTIQAFVDTILPEVGERIWGGNEQIEAA